MAEQIMFAREHISDTVIEQIRQNLRRYATAGKLVEPPGEGTSIDPFGVQVLFNKTNPHLVRFRGVTHDNIEWSSDVDFRALSREYMEQLYEGIRQGIQNKRRERQGRGPIIIPGEVEKELAADKHPSLLAPNAADDATKH